MLWTRQHGMLQIPALRRLSEYETCIIVEVLWTQEHSPACRASAPLASSNLLRICFGMSEKVTVRFRLAEGTPSWLAKL